MAAYQDREFPGIEAAVLDFCEIDRPRRFVPFFSGGNKMYLCEKNMASLYQNSLLKFEPNRLWPMPTKGGIGGSGRRWS